VLPKLRPLEDVDLGAVPWLIVRAPLADADLLRFCVAETGFREPPFVFPILREDPEDARFRDVVDAPVVFPALDACRFIMALAPA